ncbi:beta-ketoacyl synthase N-terminal-like domain-containing protein [Streptomyces sp. NPDC047065]|uniref:beta-ketoacyl [acyl carrier protein] synthase domain-containing protein n=1 Tax=Streptomyces sp. NPDC047065 TaxID=3154606 RepID=UPI0033F8A1BC
MDNREILERFKNGSLDHRDAAALLGRTPPVLFTPPAPGVRPPEEPRGRDGYAVVGMGGRYPQAPDLESFWRNALAGHRTRGAAAAGRGKGSTGRPGHALDGIDEFDPEFFGLADEDGALTDPQERLFLETAWQTLENAGYVGARLDALVPAAGGGQRGVGVWVGASSGDYALLAAAHTSGDPHRAPRNGHWSLPDRLSRLLDLSGPSQAVDTGDSSFLTALHLAVASLRAGECAAALVGAVELRLHPARHTADGGEGVGVVLLRPLATAEADGDTVHAVLRTSSVGRPASDIAHGVTLCETKESVAAAVGDAGAAVGAAALTRAVLQLREGTRAPVADGESAQPWTEESPRRASVCVRGAGAVVARVVVEEYLPQGAEPAPGPVSSPGGEELVLLSAPSPAHLAATAARLATELRIRQPELGAVAHALRSGRAAMDCRLAVIAGTTARLAEALSLFAEDDDGARDDGAATTAQEAAAPVVRVVDLRPGRSDPWLLTGLPETRDYLAALWRTNRTEQLARLWLAGVDVCVAGEGPVASLPGTALLRRPLWIGRDG